MFSQVCPQGGGVLKGGTPGPRGKHPPFWTQRQTPLLDPEADTPPPRGRHTPQNSEADTLSPSPTVETATEEGGTHQTGMHSCFFYEHTVTPTSIQSADMT